MTTDRYDHDKRANTNESQISPGTAGEPGQCPGVRGRFYRPGSQPVHPEPTGVDPPTGRGVCPDVTTDRYDHDKRANTNESQISPGTAGEPGQCPGVRGRFYRPGSQPVHPEPTGVDPPTGRGVCPDVTTDRYDHDKRANTNESQISPGTAGEPGQCPGVRGRFYRPGSQPVHPEPTGVDPPTGRGVGSDESNKHHDDKHGNSDESRGSQRPDRKPGQRANVWVYDRPDGRIVDPEPVGVDSSTD